MPLSYSAYFDPDRGYYRARRWGYIAQKRIDGAPRIPDDWWKARGFEPPDGPCDKYDKMALRFAAAEAQRHEQELIARQGRPADRKTLADTFELLKSLNPELAGERTVAKWEADYAALVKFIDPNIFPENVDVALATRYRNWRMSQKHNGRPIRSRTIRNELQFLRQLVRFAFDFMSETGSTGIRYNALPELPVEATTQIALTEAEFALLLDKADRRDADLLVTGATTMLRKTNLLELRAEWTDLERAWLHIDKDRMKGRTGRKRDLDIPLATWTVETLKDRHVSHGPYFRNKRTGQTLTWLTRTLDGLAEDAKVREFSLQDLRVTGNSWLYAAGVPELVIGALMGHAPPQETSQKSATRIYTHVFEKQLREALATFDEVRTRIMGHGTSKTA